MPHVSIRKLTMLIAAAAMLTGCGYAPLPMAPTSGEFYNPPSVVRQAVSPQLPKGVTAKTLTLEPAQSLARVGESIQLRVTVTGTDGKTYTDPRLASWTLSNPQLGYVDANGVLQPQLSGSVKVVATVGALSAEAAFEIEPPRYVWQQVMSPTTVNLKAVKMVTRYEAWAAGDGGTMLHFLNGAWQRYPGFRQLDAKIRGIDFADSATGWAVGVRGNGETPFISRFVNGMWQTQSVPVSEGSLNAVSVISKNDAWAVGEEGNGDALILHWDGASWKHVAAPARGKLNDIQMLSAKRGFAVGKFAGGSKIPMIFSFRDGAWEKNGLWDNRSNISASDQELTAIKMVSETQGYAVGISDPLLLKPRGLFLQYDPKQDRFVPGQWDAGSKDLNQVPLRDLAMISGTEGWALGETRRPDFSLDRNPQSIFGNLLSNNNGVLKLDKNYFSGNLSAAFNAIDLLPQGEGFVVGEGGYILQRTYDWRGISNGGSTGGGYGSGYGENQGQANPITYGPGGSTVVGSDPVN